VLDSNVDITAIAVITVSVYVASKSLIISPLAVTVEQITTERIVSLLVAGE
jgi:hypothetical protein